MNGTAAEAIIDLYRRHGAAWARLRGNVLVERPWLDRFCALLPAGPVADIGCGAGVPIARALVDRGIDVVGIDAAPEMLAPFRRNLTDQATIRADMRNLALGRRFAGCWHGTASSILPPTHSAACSPVSPRMRCMTRR